MPLTVFRVTLTALVGLCKRLTEWMVRRGDVLEQRRERLVHQRGWLVRNWARAFDRRVVLGWERKVCKRSGCDGSLLILRSVAVEVGPEPLIPTFKLVG